MCMQDRTKYIDDKPENECNNQQESRKIIIPLGRTDEGIDIDRDLSLIPHILVCGFTGTGKTSFVQTILSVICKNNSSDDVKLFIYDSREIEYTPFNDVPHLMFSVTNDRNKAISIINWIATESQERFGKFAELRCKDIDSYNKRVPEEKRLPIIIMILDDFSNLSLNRDEMIDFMTILKNGRLSGIHAIVVSSMLSTKTVQKELISNIPCKVTFRVTSKTESHNIINSAGAELLRVPGEMIYLYQNDFCKCQAAYIQFDDITSDMKKLSESAVSKLRPQMIDKHKLGNAEQNMFFDGDRLDELFEKVGRMIIRNNKASIGTIQREFKIGFNRASKIMEELAQNGVVEPEYGTKPRIVLMTEEKFDDFILQKYGVVNKSDFPYKQSSHGSNYKKNADEPKVSLREFEKFSIGENTLSIHDHRIHFTKTIMTNKGRGILTGSFDGSKVSGLIYKKPSFFSRGYMSFEFLSSVKVNNEDPHLIRADEKNISEVVKFEFSSGQDKIIKLFLQQLSEDIGIPIKSL